MSVAKDPNGNECCLRVDAAGSLLTFTGTRMAADEADVSRLIFGEMKLFGVDPGYPWIEADGRQVMARGRQYTLPRANHMYVYLPG